MCTNITWKNNTNFIGRNMDIGFDFDKKIVITPRNFILNFMEEKPIKKHYAIIGTAQITNNYPLYCEAFNEKGLYIAGLNYPNNTKYYEFSKDKSNISVNELIPWILSQCSNIKEAKALIKKTNILNKTIDSNLPIPSLHFILSDDSTSLVIECEKDEMKVYENNIGILTNNPSYDIHIKNLNNYNHVTPINKIENLKKENQITHFCTGLGTIGLPGDYSSQSRFIKAYYLKNHSIANTDYESVLQMFHMLNSVAFVKGSVIDEHDNLDITIYSSCCDIKNLTYYFKTYNSSNIQAVKLNNLDNKQLVIYDHSDFTNIKYLN